MYQGPDDIKVSDIFDLHAECYGGDFLCLEPSGGFTYDVGGILLDLSGETEEKLLELIERSRSAGKDLVYETYKDKAFNPHPYPDALD